MDPVEFSGLCGMYGWKTHRRTMQHVPKFNSRKISYQVGPHKFYKFWFYDDVIERMTPENVLELLKLKQIPDSLKDDIEDYSTEELRKT